MTLLSLLVAGMAIFAPFYLQRGDIKSLYDGLGVMDMNDYVVITNRIYNFVSFYTPPNIYLKSDPSVYPLLWHEQPLVYTLSKINSKLIRKWQVTTAFDDRVYDSHIYQIVYDKKDLVLISEYFGIDTTWKSSTWSKQIRLKHG
jgi:hypothetical protein